MTQTHRLLVLTLLAAIVVIDVAGMRHLSVTYDEPRHLRYGENILQLDSSRFDDSKMPVSALNAVVSAVAGRLGLVDGGSVEGRIRAGRYATVLASLVLALCVFAWSFELFGAAAGLLSLALYAFDPNLLAHSQLVTTDVFAACAMTVALYLLWRALTRRAWSSWLLAGVGIGIAQIAKYTALALFPLAAIVAVLFHLRTTTYRWRDAVAAAAIVAALSLLIVNAGFLFNRTGTPLRDYPFRSDTFRGLQRTAGRLANVPLPVPYPYLEGLDWVVQRERTGEGYGPIYLFGQLRHGAGFPGYYFAATLFKMPIGSQLLVLTALVVLAASWRRWIDLRDHWVLLCPLLFFTVYFNFLYRAQIGIRYFLIVFPLVYVLAGSLLRRGRPLTRRLVAGVGVAMACTVASVLFNTPHLLAYVDELLPNRRLAYRVFADSNIDWGQHRWYLAEYRAAHPDAIIEPDRPTAGTILVGVNALTGVAGDPERFRWLRDNFVPIDDVARSVLVYRIYPADLDRMRK